MKIGYCSNNYPEQRCIINKTIESKYVYLPSSRLLKILELAEKKLFKKNISKFQFTHWRLNHKKINGYHFFNHITFTNMPYITTFETFLPRINEFSNLHHSKNGVLELTNLSYAEKQLSLLSKNNCKKIIALSKCNYEMQKELLKLFPHLNDTILNKMVQINPPQEVIVNTYEDKNLHKEIIRFVFVGRDFIRKGGVEIVEAFQSIMKKYNFPLELILITNLEKTHNYAFKNFQDTDFQQKKIKEIINTSTWIKHYPTLPNSEVMEIIKTSHVGLLPTYADTYGYSVLEFQAAGCPVITTNVRAIKEINNNNCGWIIELPTNKFGELGIETLKDKEELRNKIITELKSIIIHIFENKECIKSKGLNSIDRIKQEHCPNEYNKILMDIYSDVF